VVSRAPAVAALFVAAVAQAEPRSIATPYTPYEERAIRDAEAELAASVDRL
jgi:hypothetical protein